MSGLLPIIRRVRRPLLPVEAPAEAKRVAVEAKTASKVEEAGEREPRKDNDGKVGSSERRG